LRKENKDPIDLLMKDRVRLTKNKINIKKE